MTGVFLLVMNNLEAAGNLRSPATSLALALCLTLYLPVSALKLYLPALAYHPTVGFPSVTQKRQKL